MPGNIAFVLYGAVYLSLGLMNLVRLQDVVPFQYRLFEKLETWQRSWGWTNVFAGILSCIGFVLYDPALFVFNSAIAKIILISEFSFLFIHLLYLTPSATAFSPYHSAFSRVVQVVIIFEYIILLVWLILCAGRWGSVAQTFG